MSNIAKHHMVAIASCLDPVTKMSTVVGCMNLANLDPSYFSNFLDATICHLHFAGFNVCMLTGDGAKENVKLFENWSRKPIIDFIPEDLRNDFPDIDFRVQNMGVHPHLLSNKPIFLVEDMPHMAKRVCRNLENSLIKAKKRDLRYGVNGQPMNLHMIKSVWEEYIESDHYRLPETALAYAHFEKDQLMRMRVILAVQVMSNRMHEMLDEATQDMAQDNFKRVTGGLYPNQYKKLKELLKAMNRLVDIVNGKSVSREKMPITPDNGKTIQWELLEILDFFLKWYKANNKNGDMNKFNFLALDTWNGLQRMILGYVGLIHSRVINKKNTIHPRATTSDSCEHYFSRARSSFGSTDSGTANDFNNHAGIPGHLI
jgi:hypothetical protein